MFYYFYRFSVVKLRSSTLYKVL